MYSATRPAGWPAPGPQGDGSYVEYLHYRNSSRLRGWRSHPNYIAYVLAATGGNKRRLLARIFLATGGNPTDTDGFQAFEAQHSSRKWTFRYLHHIYDEHLAPEHRYAA